MASVFDSSLSLHICIACERVWFGVFVCLLFEFTSIRAIDRNCAKTKQNTEHLLWYVDDNGR